MDVKIKLYITDEQGDKFLGIGVIWLLEAIGRHASIRQAAEELQLSYTKALRMLKVLEESLSREVVKRRKGGDSRKGAVLTPYGDFLISQYKKFQEKVRHDTREAFQEYILPLNKEFPE